jgi:hypothetical protein
MVCSGSGRSAVLRALTFSPLVKALYDYQAQSGKYTSGGETVTILTTNSTTLGSEFDFQEGDIIAVTATPPDGWWSGKLESMARPD